MCGIRLGVDHSRAWSRPFPTQRVSSAARLHPGKPPLDKKNAAFRFKIVSSNRVPRAFAGAKQRPQLTPELPSTTVCFRAQRRRVLT
jgi:hypothetical protein